MLDTIHKKKSAGLTAVVAILLLLLFFMLGLTYYDPPISYGMEVNFGTLAQGNGDVQPTKSVQTFEQPVEKPVQVEEKAEVTLPKESAQESIKEVLTEKESTVVVPNKKEEVKPREAVEGKLEPKVEPEPVKEVPKVSEATKSVVSNLLKNKAEEGEQIQGEGDDLVQGDKGKVEGNPYSSSYYNNYGLGGRGKGYGLNGRNLQSNGKVIQDCNQEGTVVVRITVNNNGDVVQAVPGVKGSTNTHLCLLEPARKTALLHKWFPDNNAPAEQIGFVVIQFKLGE
jgi:outer membrane biosynthesis protein TonB|tara:strand:+ start:1248 stop:2096 length:849 start_codon:yes stop_codon:yes gene_type:complete